jgi:UPF0716 protein FxsA
MFLTLVILFALLPLAEVFLLVEVGRAAGALNTLGLVVATALLGATLTRHQGMIVVQRIRESLAQGMVPAEEVVDAVLIFVAGIVLITPGFITDAVGFLLLIPQTRTAVKHWLREKFRQWIDRGDMRIRFFT